jgi:hypothetical protein
MIYANIFEQDNENQYRSSEQIKDTLKTKDADNLMLYPNPTKGLIIIERPKNQEEIISIKIYNSEGVLIYNNNSIDCYSLTIDISAQPKGVYFFRATSGNNVFLEKIIYQ